MFQHSPELDKSTINKLLFFARIGLYFDVRKLLFFGLEKVSSSRIPFLHSIATKIISRLETMPDAELNLKLISDLHGLQPLVRILDEKY